MYEVLTTEPLRDAKEHILNIINEIPVHLSNDQKKLCEETVQLVMGTKEQLRGSDYREICIVLANIFCKKCDLSIHCTYYYIICFISIGIIIIMLTAQCGLTTER